MKVWVVEKELEWGNWRIIDIFDSEEKAQEYVKRLSGYVICDYNDWEVK